MIDHCHLALLMLFVVVVCYGLWHIIYLRYDILLEFSVINAIYIASFVDQMRGRYPINILTKLDDPHQQEQRKRAIQFVKGGTTLCGCTITVKFDYFE